MTDATEKNDASPENAGMDEQKKRELLEKYGYKRNAEPAEPAETGACGKTRRRTCC
jgi:hypothetical protein